MPILRVDDEVWKWLQGQGRPFEDTPNSVLRRVAGLDQTTASNHKSAATGTLATEAKVSRDSSPNRNTLSKRVTGEQLNHKYRLGARHALYHKDGTFYERLTSFPGVLCDTKGFVRYEDAQQFQRDSRLNIGEKVNVHQSIASHPRYRRFSSQG
jgi:hypothetical protein